MNYIAKIKTEKLDQQSGKSKKVSEEYFVKDAISFAETDNIVNEKLADEYNEFEVQSITRSSVEQVFVFEHGEFFWNIKYAFVDIDEESGKEKKVKKQVLLNANTHGDATKRFHTEMKEMIVPYEVVKVGITNVVGVFGVDLVFSEDKFTEKEMIEMENRFYNSEEDDSEGMDTTENTFVID